ncbi:MAG: hypothetical protein AB1656_14800 [Candidatus Omnitrophota bacterium]
MIHLRFSFTKGFIVFSVLMLSCVFAPRSMAQEAAAAEEGPLAIHLYLFTMDKADMTAMLKDGLSGKELDQLQKERFEAGCLFKEKEAKQIKKGENKVDIPMEIVKAMPEDSSSKIIVFFYAINRTGEAAKQEMTLSRNSYIVTETDGVQKKLAPKEGTWRLPAQSKPFRIMDFRNAARFFKGLFTYEIAIQGGEAADKYVIQLNVVE